MTFVISDEGIDPLLVDRCRTKKSASGLIPAAPGREHAGTKETEDTPVVTLGHCAIGIGITSGSATRNDPKLKVEGRAWAMYILAAADSHWSGTHRCPTWRGAIKEDCQDGAVCASGWRRKIASRSRSPSWVALDGTEKRRGRTSRFSGDRRGGGIYVPAKWWR